MKSLVTIIMGLFVLALAGQAARADWDPNDPYKWLQLPDLEPYKGMDVYDKSRWLADDFLCTSTNKITDIHIWGSWKNDVLPSYWPAGGTFSLKIYGDIPANPLDPCTHSEPNENKVLWQRTLVPTSYRLYATGLQEGWYDPNTSEYIPWGDSNCYQYNFLIPEANAFMQQGDPNNPIVYWLGVQAIVNDANAKFGWKTSADHWNDDATWRMGGNWYELTYPSGHPLCGQSIDLAFVITPEPATLSLLAVGGLAILRRGSGQKLRRRKSA